MKDQRPLVSIVTVCYNSEKTIERTIKSVLSQSYKNIEFIIIDGQSTDNTKLIVKKYKKKIKKFISEKDKGIYDAFNKGLKIFNGDVIGFVNYDDFLIKWDINDISFGIVKQNLINGLSRGDSFYCSIDLEIAKQFISSRKLPQKNYILIGVDLPENSKIECEFESNDVEEIKTYMLRQV